MNFSALAVALSLLALGLGTPCAHAESQPDAQPEARPDEGIGPSWTAGAFFIVGKPGAFGGETSLGAQFKPLTAHALYVGPKISALYAAADNGKARFDLNVGVAETTWFVNAIGSGIDLDAVVVSHLTGEDSSVHFRVTPNLAIRSLAFKSEGAWAVRVGIPYDTHYKWGIQAGVTLQLNGVARLGD